MARVPCTECAAMGVWIRLSNVRVERKRVVMAWQCQSCGHAWTETSVRAFPLKASSSSVKPSRKRRGA